MSMTQPQPLLCSKRDEADEAPSLEESLTTTPPHWCEVCQIDCQSATTLRKHQRGKKHRRRGGLPPPATAYSYIYAQRLVPGVDEFGCLLDGGGGGGTDYREITRAKPIREPDEIIADDVDLSRIDDTARMRQRLYDDAVVELALYNYECYHGLTRGAATYDQVRATSASILGWSACLLDASSGNDGSGSKGGSNATTTVVVGAAHKQAPPEPRNGRAKSDEQESLQLQMALLESMGARPSALPITGEDEEDDNDDYTYEDDDDEDRSDNSSRASPGVRISDDDDNERWSLVSNSTTSSTSSYVMPDLADFSAATSGAEEL